MIENGGSQSFWRIGFGHVLIMLTMLISVVMTYMKLDGSVTLWSNKTQDNTMEIVRLRTSNDSIIPGMAEMRAGFSDMKVEIREISGMVRELKIKDQVAREKEKR